MLSVFQAINWTFMFINTKYMFCTNLIILCPLFIWTGFMGGGAYVNVMHNLLEMKELEDNEREAALVLSLMFNDFGVLMSAIFTLAIDNTIF